MVIPQSDWEDFKARVIERIGPEAIARHLRHWFPRSDHYQSWKAYCFGNQILIDGTYQDPATVFDFLQRIHCPRQIQKFQGILGNRPKPWSSANDFVTLQFNPEELAPLYLGTVEQDPAPWGPEIEREIREVSNSTVLGILNSPDLDVDRLREQIEQSLKVEYHEVLEKRSQIVIRPTRRSTLFRALTIAENNGWRLIETSGPEPIVTYVSGAVGVKALTYPFPALMFESENDTRISRVFRVPTTRIRTINVFGPVFLVELSTLECACLNLPPLPST